MHSHLDKKLQVPLGGGWAKQCKFFQCCRVLPQGDLPPFFQGFLGLETVSSPGIDGEANSVWVIQLRLLFTCLHRSRIHLACPFLSFQGIPWSTGQYPRSLQVQWLWVLFRLCWYHNGIHSHLISGDLSSTTWSLPPWNPIIPIVFKDPSSVAVVPTIISDLQRKVTTELCNDAGLPSQIYFSQAWWKVCPLDPPRVGELVSHDKSTLMDFPSGPVGKTPCYQCRGPGFDPWWGI